MTITIFCSSSVVMIDVFLSSFTLVLDCEQSLFFFRFSKLGECTRVGVERRSRETREKRAAARRAFSHARGNLRVSGVLLDGPRKKRDCS